MAKAKVNLVLMVPEGQTKDNAEYSFVLNKPKCMLREQRKFRMRKYNPVSRKHCWFEESRMPAHSK